MMMNTLALSLLMLMSFLLTSEAEPLRNRNNNKNHGLYRENENSKFVRLIPQTSCYYQGYNKRLICSCESPDDSAYLHLRMNYYVLDANNDIRQIHLTHCKELRVTLDYRDVDTTNYPVYFRAIRKLDIEKIMFEPTYSDRQELLLNFENVDTFEFNKVFVEDTLIIKATNVKEARFIKSTFAHVPRGGFQISEAKTLDIRDCTFIRVSPKSIVIEKTKDVRVLGNEMSTNAVQVVHAKDGSHLMISCNRLLGAQISPECSKTTTTTTTTTTTITSTTSTTTTMRDILPPTKLSKSEEDKGFGFLPELIGGIAAGLLLIVIILLIFICILRKKVKKEPPEKTPNNPETATASKPESPIKEPEKEIKDDNIELGVEPNINNHKNREQMHQVEEDQRPKFASPIWIEEIQKNKIFNRQKSLLSQDHLKDLAEGNKEKDKEEEEEEELPLPPTPPPPPPQTVDEEIKESSRTESDEDCDKSAATDPLNNSSSAEAEVEPDPDENDQFLPPPPPPVVVVVPPIPIINDAMKEDIDEMESLLRKVREQEKALHEDF